MDNSALYKIGYGLYLLTAKDGEKDNGCITNTLMQVSSKPLTAVIAVNKQNYTHYMIMKTGQFNVSTLTQNTPFEVIKQFGFQSGRDVDKFNRIPYARRSPSGIIYIEEYANAYMTFKVRETLDFVTHTLFTADITDAVKLSDDESLTYSYYQSNIKPRPAKKAKGWQCKICGYIYEDDELPEDFICPLCKHPASDFVKL